MSRDPPATVEISLERIANYLERIADALDTGGDSVVTILDTLSTNVREITRHLTSKE